MKKKIKELYVITYQQLIYCIANGKSKIEWV